MAKATEYIKHLEKRNKSLVDDMIALQSRLAVLEGHREQIFETTSSPGRSRQSSLNTPIGPFSIQSPQVQAATVMHRHPYAQARSAASVSECSEGPSLEIVKDETGTKARRGRKGAMGKMMVASMAGFMAMEGIAEHRRAQPLASHPLFRRHDLASSNIHPSNLIFQLLKLFMVLAAFAYLASPWYWKTAKPKTQETTELKLAGVPSLASPVEMKRKAWLTAIQAVWVPRPFLLEVVAVAVRMTQLSLRRLIGFDRYTEMFGGSKDHEAARIKAWDIAIDAQLAGGDAKVSYYRLLLTLMASGTLPDSPIRLMQKAVHFRIFFWEVANAGYGNLFMFRDFTAKVTQIYWDSARKLHHDLATGAVSKLDELDRTIELLPPHLAALIDLRCDQVLTDEIIQRAYNLAWNRPSAENTCSKPTLNQVVEDPSIRSPLDAIAAWFTNMIVDAALGLVVTGDASTGTLIELAVKTAPPASLTLTRTVVTKAIVVDVDREKSIASALESMPPEDSSKTQAVHLDVVDHIPLTPEIRIALTLAKVLSFVDSGHTPNSHAYAAAVLTGINIPAGQLTTLTAVATFKILEHTVAAPELVKVAGRGLRQSSFNLRLWLGTKSGRDSCLQRKEKALIVAKCVEIAKQVGGWCDSDAVDSGYGSAVSRRASDGS